MGEGNTDDAAEEPVIKILMGEAYNTKEESAKKLRKVKDKETNVVTEKHLERDVPRRFNRILGIILKQNPDVITMQELDHHYDFMLPKLRSMGYDGIFQPKHKSTCSRWNGGLPDGVAVFWNTERIQNVGGIGQVPVGYKGTGSLYDDEEKTQRSAQIAIAVKSQIIETEQEFLVMTAHLASGNKRNVLPKKIAQAKQVAGIIAESDIPVVFACDFNNAPGGIGHNPFFKELLCKNTRCPLGVARNTEMTDLQNLNWQRALTIEPTKKLQKQKDITAAEKTKLLPKVVRLSTGYVTAPLLSPAEFEKAKAIVAQA